jgi:hypothetical protein
MAMALVFASPRAGGGDHHFIVEEVRAVAASLQDVETMNVARVDARLI